MELQVGESVRLKSGSPTMTVEALDEGDVHVVWMDAKGKVGRDVFDPRLLEKIAKGTIAFSN